MMLDIETLFTYRAPSDQQIANLQNVREAAKHLAYTIMDNCPSGPDRTTAIRMLRECTMTANASIVVPTVAAIP